MKPKWVSLGEKVYTTGISVWMGEGITRLVTQSHRPTEGFVILCIFIAAPVYAICRQMCVSGSRYWGLAVAVVTLMASMAVYGFSMYGSFWVALIGSLALMATQGRFITMDA